MNWEDRLRDAAYTSPSGTRLTFDYEATTEQFEQKGGPFEFADADGTYVQPMGVTGRRYPLRLIMWGRDCDTESAAWMSALSESGQGVLEHPVYGRVDVVPVGTVKRRDDLVRSANQSIIEVEFFATIGLVYPSTAERETQTLSTSIDEADAAQSSQLEDAALTKKASFLTQYNTALDKVSEALSSVAPDYNAFNAIEASIKRGIDVLIADPITLAYQTQQLIQQPGRALSSATARVDAYFDLAKSLIGVTDTDTTPTTPTAATNAVDLSVGDMFASATGVAAAQASVNTEYTNRAAAVDAAENLLDMMDDLAEYRDDSYLNIEEVDTGASWQATQQVIAEAAGTLVKVSFRLAQQRTIVIAAPRSIIDLSYELYGEVDDTLDNLINDNDLTGDEIIELPRGREVVYYV